MKVYRSSEYESLDQLRDSLGWDFWMEGGPAAEVREIITRVREEGDAALIDLTREFDNADIAKGKIRVSKVELDRSANKVERSFTDAVKAATKSITSFHRHQAWESQFWESEEGARVGQMTKPIDRIGTYIPGGHGAYPSTAMMTVIPARVAGVTEIAACVPPAENGEINPYTLYTLHSLGVEEVYRIGGAQAVAAMALGTETVRAVDKIVGPGNIYVSLAKKELFGLVGIDMLAGPSELVVLADDEADTRYVALEMLAQIEHGAGARACLVTCSENIVGEVEKELSSSKGGREAERTSLIAAVIVEDLEDGVRVVNGLAPEHLIIATSEVTGVVEKVHNAGAVFLGMESPVALGDYTVGVNHVLPTKGAARFSSPLGVYDFVKRSNIVFSNPKANRALGPVVEALARVEGFTAHAEAMRKHIH